MLFNSKRLALITCLLVLMFSVRTVDGSLTDGSFVPKQLTDQVVSYICSPLTYTFESLLYIAGEAVNVVCFPLLFVINGVTSGIYSVKSLCEFVVDTLLILLDIIVRNPVLFIYYTVSYVMSYALCKPLVFLLHNIIIALTMPFNVVFYEQSVVSALQWAVALPVEFIFDSLMFVVRSCVDMFFLLFIDFLLHFLIKKLIYAILDLLFVIPLLPLVLVQYVMQTVIFLLNHSLALVCNLLLSAIFEVCSVVVFIIIFCAHWILEAFLAVMLALSCLVLLAVAGLVCLGLYCLYVWRFGDMASDRLIQFIIKTVVDLQRSEEYTVFHLIMDELPFDISSLVQQLMRGRYREKDFQDDDEKSCVVCFHDKPLVRIEPCGHTNVCEECLQQIVTINNKCPLCRTLIRQTVDLWR